MRDRILRVLRWALRLLLPAHGEHRTTAPTTPEPAPELVPVTLGISVWRKPWRTPSSAEAREIFRSPEVWGRTPEQRDHWFATAWAERGYDYPHRYKGDQFEQYERARRTGDSA
ncbi:hypothetical protein [Streptomyces luteireticuli]|uniref:hypothetical protein n=1 Tax=Streptomyces luteireticuli TaxID=173858 RepID=UPI0035588940